MTYRSDFSPPAGAGKIALIDDDDAIRDSLTLLLNAHGWMSLSFSSGEAFLASFASVDPDCLILDPHLPGITGLDVVQKLSELQARCPVIGLTAWPTSRLTEQLRQTGICSMLIKPVGAERLLAEIGVALHSSLQPASRTE